jgi:hypothetical protein
MHAFRDSDVRRSLGRVDRADVLLEEYRTLREEALQAMQQQGTILQFGLAALTLLLGLSAQIKVLEAAAALQFAAVPLLAWLVLVVWQGEVSRMRRAGRFIADLEKEINKEITQEGPGLSWETTLQKDAPPYRRLRGRYQAVFFLLMSVALVSMGAGVAFVVVARHAWELTFWIPLSAILVFGACGWYLYELHEQRLGKDRDG